MKNKNITIVQGDTFAFGVEFQGLDQDLETAFFTCKDIDNETLIFQKSLADGISKVEDEKYRVRIAPEDTITRAPGKYLYDFTIGVNSDNFTLMEGILTVTRSITRG